MTFFSASSIFLWYYVLTISTKIELRLHVMWTVVSIYHLTGSAIICGTEIKQAEEQNEAAVSLFVH